MDRSQNFLRSFKDAACHPDTILPLVIGLFLILVHWAIPYNWIFYKSGYLETKNIQLELDKSIDSFNKITDSQLLSINWNSKISTVYNGQKPYLNLYKYIKNDSGFLRKYWTSVRALSNKDFLLESSQNFYINDSLILQKRKISDSVFFIGEIDINLLVSEYWDCGKVLFEKNYSPRFYSIHKEKPSSNLEQFEIKIHGVPSFYIQKYNQLTDFNNIILIILTFIEIIFVLLGIINFAKKLSIKYQMTSLIFFTTTLLLLRFIFLKLKLPAFFYNLKLFNPALYSGSSINPTLGDFLIFLLINQLIILFLYKRVHPKLIIFKRIKWLGWLLHTTVIMFFLGETFSIIKVFETFTLKSSIWFNFNYFPRINIYSIIGLSILLITFSNYFLLTKKALKTIWKIKLSNVAFVFSILIVLLSVIIIFRNYEKEYLVVALILFSFFVLLFLSFKFRIKSINTTPVLFILFASLLTTYLLNYFNTKKEKIVKESIANELAFRYSDNTKNEIFNFYQCCNSTPNFCINNEIYNYKIDTYELRKHLHSEIIQSSPKSTLLKSIRNSKTFYIIQLFDIKKELEISVKEDISKISPNLQSSIYNQVIGENYVNYAVYFKDTLIENNVNYPFNKIYNYSTNNSNEIIESSTTQNYKNQVFYFPKDNLKVIVSAYSSKTISIFVLFSYIIGFNITLYIISFLLTKIYFYLFIKKVNFLNNIKFSLYKKILLMLTGLVTLFFIVITIVSIKNLSIKAFENKRDVLLTKSNLIQAELDNKVIVPFSPAFQKLLKKLASSNQVNINVYDFSGEMIYSSEPIVSQKKWLHPILMKAINNKNYLGIYQFGEQEKELAVTQIISDINKFNKYLVYISVTKENQRLAFDEMNFLVSLINLFVFIFIIALFVSFIIGNLITNPLKIITYRISNLAISGKNDTIDYESNDEIGNLVKQYNLMAKNLESNVKQLASNEREMAWREMAKQVAHEIKNPLTPMKLKIQMVQRKISEGYTNDMEESIKRLMDSLIEQIDILANIANDFSNFAKFRDAKIEEIDLISVLKNVTELFESVRNSQVSLNLTITDAIVMADRDQLVSCFNNLIKNGIQSALSIDRDIPKVTVTLIEDLFAYKILFEDNGGGISDDIIDKIFTPKFTTKSSGSGLGLAITKSFLEQIGGQITLLRTSPEGSTFEILLKKANISTQINH